MKKTIFIIFILSSLCLFSETDFFSMYLDSMETAYKKDNPQLVEKYYQILTNYDAERYEPYYYFATVLHSLKQTKDAIPLIGKAVELNPSEETYFAYAKMLFNYDEKLFLQTVNTALSAYPVSEGLNALKLDYFNSKNMPDSAYSYALFIKKRIPKDKGALYALAKYEAKKENYVLADSYLGELLSLKEPRNEDYLLAGRIYSDAKNYIAANKSYMKLINSPYRYYSLHKLSDNYFALGFYDSTLTMLDSLVKHYPDSVSAYNKMLALFAKNRDIALLNKVYERSTKADISDSIFLVNCAGELFKCDSLTQASKLYAKLYEKSPSFSSKEYVQTLFFLKDYASSKKILSLYPMKSASDSLFVYKYYGLVFFKTNQTDSSEFYFERAYLLNDKDANLIKNLANAYYLNQKMVKLTELTETIKSSFPALSDSLSDKYFKKTE
ncbi:MAG: hypothetical protein PHW02_08280 [bacterium]|nr:hypothetical protein [bacterium]